MRRHAALQRRGRPRSVGALREPVGVHRTEASTSVREVAEALRARIAAWAELRPPMHRFLEEGALNPTSRGMRLQYSHGAPDSAQGLVEVVVDVSDRPSRMDGDAESFQLGSAHVSVVVHSRGEDIQRGSLSSLRGGDGLRWEWRRRSAFRNGLGHARERPGTREDRSHRRRWPPKGRSGGGVGRRAPRRGRW